jgi:Uma2 family endonuclease
MLSTMRFTSADLEVLPQVEGKRYEIIGGELLMSCQPHYHHQLTCSNITRLLGNWSVESGLGQTAIAPGILFADDDDVAPDVVWCSYALLDKVLGDDGKFHAAPELVIEVLSPGSANERRDRETKLKLYSRRGVQEYWILDWLIGRAEVFRRKQRQLRLAETLSKPDVLRSPLLPGFACKVADVFDYPPRKHGTNGQSRPQTKRRK